MKKSIKESLIYLLLGLLARYLIRVLRPFLGWSYTIVRVLFTKRFGWKEIRQYAQDIAVSEDQNANVYVKYFFDDVMTTRMSLNEFGFPDETISSVFGKNKRSLTLTKFGLFWAWFLNKVERDHVEKSIEEDEGIKVVKKKKRGPYKKRKKPASKNIQNKTVNKS
jgi:hypothetical protein